MDDSSSPSSAGGHGRQARGAHHGSSTGGGGGRGKQERRKPRGGGGGGGASGGGDSGDSQWQHDRFDHSPKHHGSYQSDHRRGGGGGGGRGGGRHTVQRQVVARDETGLISSVKDSYGFIKCCDRNQRMFFHFSELQPSRDSSEQPPGQVGDEVQFDVALDPEGKSSAVNIRLLPPGSVSFERVLDGRMEGIVTRSLAGDLLDRWAQRPDAKELLSRLSAAAAASSSSSSSSSFSNDRPKRAFIPGVICFSTRDSTNEPSSSTEAAAIDGTAATAATAAAATSLEEAQGSNATVASDGASPSAAATSALVDEETETVTFTGRDIESSKFDAAAGDVVSFQFAVDKRTGERRATNIRLVKKAPEERFTGFITSIKPPYGFIDCCERDQTIFFSLSEIQQPAAATPAPAPVPAAAATTTSTDDATTAAPDASSDSKTETTSEPPAPIAAATTPAAPAAITWGGRSPAPKTTVPHIKERQEVEFSLVTDRKSKEKRAVNIKLLPPGSISLHNILPERERGFVSKPIPERRSKQHRLDRVRSDPLDELGRIEKIIGIDEENNMETVEILSFAARDLEQPYIKLRFDDEVEFNVAVEKRTGKRRCTNISLVQPANEQREAGCIEAVKEGFGFIRRLRSDTELYFHFSDIELPEQRLAVGTEVDFIVDEDAQSHKQFAARIRPLQQTLHDGVLIGYVQRLPTRGAKRHSDSSSNGTILVNKFVPVVAAPATPAPDAAPEATATAPATTDASPATPAADATTTIPDQQQQHEEEDDEEHDAEHESDDEHEAATPAAAAAAAATVVTATASATDATVKPTKRPSSKPRQRRVEEHIEFDLSGVEANQELVVGEQVMFRLLTTDSINRKKAVNITSQRVIGRVTSSKTGLKLTRIPPSELATLELAVPVPPKPTLTPGYLVPAKVKSFSFLDRVAGNLRAGDIVEFSLVIRRGNAISKPKATRVTILKSAPASPPALVRKRKPIFDKEPQPESGESVAIIQPIRAPRGPEAGKAWAFVRSVTCPLVKQAEVVEPEVVTPEPSVAEAPAASSASDSPVAVPDAVASTSTESTSAPVDATATPPPAVAASSTDDATVPPAEQTQPLSATEQ